MTPVNRPASRADASFARCLARHVEDQQGSEIGQRPDELDEFAAE